jgi:hypothetical protein
MDIYHSYYHHEQVVYGDQTLDDGKRKRLIQIHELSCLLALKNYGNITLITNPEGKDLLGHLPYTKIELFDEYIPEIGVDVYSLIRTFPQLWMIPKIIGYRQSAKKRAPFINIDFDVFLFKRLPENIIYTDLVCQEIEYDGVLEPYYGLDYFMRLCPEKFLFSPNYYHSYNLGIFGGTNTDFIDFFTEEVLKMILHPSNQYFWKNHPNCTFLEQHYFGQCANYKNIIPTPIINIGIDPSELGYIHLVGDQKWWDLTDEPHKRTDFMQNHFYSNQPLQDSYGIQSFYYSQSLLKGNRKIELGELLQEIISELKS